MPCYKDVDVLALRRSTLCYNTNYSLFNFIFFSFVPNMNTKNASPTNCEPMNHSICVRSVVFCGWEVERGDKRPGISPNLNRRGGTKTSTIAGSSVF